MKYIKIANKKGNGQQKIKFICPNCKKEFSTRLAYYNFWKNRGQNIFYCSGNCFQKGRLDRIPTLFCIQCGKEIINKDGKRNRKFCCRVCYDLHQYKQEERTCEWCGNKFKTHSNGKRRFCCKRCALASPGETTIEKIFREELERRNIKYIQYKKIGRFFVDFLLDNNVVCECDGIYWHSKPEVIERDNRKNNYLKNNGYTLFRFTDEEILNDVGKCIDLMN